MSNLLQFPNTISDEFDTTELEQDVRALLEKFTAESVLLMLYKTVNDVNDLLLLQPSVNKILFDNANV